MFLRRGNRLETINTQEPSFFPLSLAQLNSTAGVAIELLPNTYEKSSVQTENARRRDELNLKAHQLLGKIFSVIWSTSGSKHCPSQQSVCDANPDKKSLEEPSLSKNTKKPTPEQETASNAVAKEWISNFFKSPSKLEKMLSHYISANEKKKDPDFDQTELEHLPDGIREQLSDPGEAGENPVHNNEHHRKISRKTASKREHNVNDDEAELAKSHFDAEEERSKSQNAFKQKLPLEKESEKELEQESEKESEKGILTEEKKLHHDSESRKSREIEQSLPDNEFVGVSPPGTELEDEGKILHVKKSQSKHGDEDESSEGEQFINVKPSHRTSFHRNVENLPVKSNRYLHQDFSNQEDIQKPFTNQANMHVSDTMIQNELSNYLERSFHKISPTQVTEMSKVLANILLISLNKIFPNPPTHDVPSKIEYSGIAPNSIVKPGMDDEAPLPPAQRSMFSDPPPQSLITQETDEWSKSHRRQPEAYSKPVDPDAIASLQAAPKLYTPHQMHIPVSELALHTMDNSVASAMPGTPGMFQLEDTASHVPGINPLEDQNMYQQDSTMSEQDSTMTDIPLQDNRRIHDLSANDVTQRTQGPEFQEVFPGEINFGLNRFHSPTPVGDDSQIQQQKNIAFEQPPQTRTVKAKPYDIRSKTIQKTVKNRAQTQPALAMQRSPISIDLMSYVGLDNSVVLNGDRKDNIFNANRKQNIFNAGNFLDKNMLMRKEKGIQRQQMPLRSNPDQLLDIARAANHRTISKAFPTDSSVGFDASAASEGIQDSGVDIKTPIMTDDSAAMQFDGPQHQEQSNLVNSNTDPELGSPDESVNTPDIHDPDLLLEYVNHKSLLEKTVTNYPGDVSDKLIEDTKIKEIEDTGFHNHAALLGKEHIDPAISLHLKQPLVVAGKILQMNQPERITEEIIKSAVESYAPPVGKNMQSQLGNRKSIPVQNSAQNAVRLQFNTGVVSRSSPTQKIEPNLERQGKAYTKELYLDKNDLRAAEKARQEYLSPYDKALKPIEFQNEEQKVTSDNQQHKSRYDGNIEVASSSAGNAQTVNIQHIQDSMSRVPSDLNLVSDSVPVKNRNQNENVTPEKKMSLTGFENDNSQDLDNQAQPKTSPNNILENLKAIKSYIREQKKALLSSAGEKEANYDTKEAPVSNIRETNVKTESNKMPQAESNVEEGAHKSTSITRYSKKLKSKPVIKEKESSDEVSDYDLLALNDYHKKIKEKKKSKTKQKHFTKKKKHSRSPSSSSSPADTELFFWNRMYGDMNL